MATSAFAAPPADPLLQKIIAGARAVSPASIRYERTTRSTAREAGGGSESHVRVDRWDGKQMTRISVDGKPAAAEEVEKARKASAGRPVAGYHRVADFLAVGARRVGETGGMVTYRVDKLPKGSVDLGGDKSDKFVGEAIVDTTAAVPFVSRMRFFLPKPLSIMFIAKVEKFEVVNDYRIGADGRPAQVHQVQTMSGSQFGKTGETRSESTYTPLR
ncbi:MAG: hypothetical protein ACOYLS_05280 [Polymorphobacter sp.]